MWKCQLRQMAAFESFKKIISWKNKTLYLDTRVLFSFPLTLLIPLIIMFALRRAALRAAPLSARPAVRSFSVFGARLCKCQCCYSNACAWGPGFRILRDRQQHRTHATKQNNTDNNSANSFRCSAWIAWTTHFIPFTVNSFFPIWYMTCEWLQRLTLHLIFLL